MDITHLIFIVMITPLIGKTDTSGVGVKKKKNHQHHGHGHHGHQYGPGHASGVILPGVGNLASYLICMKTTALCLYKHITLSLYIYIYIYYDVFL